MKTSQLLLSSLNITEDDYTYKGTFILSTPEKSENVDMSDLEKSSRLCDLKDAFGLEEDIAAIKSILMDMIIEKAYISSIIVEGEDYNENMKRKSSERMAKTLDMA